MLFPSNSSLRPLAKAAATSALQNRVLKIRALWIRLRVALCLTQEAAAEAVGYARQSVTQWERRGGPMVPTDALLTLLELAGLDDSALFCACRLEMTG